MDSMEASFSHAARFELFTWTESTDNIRLYQKLGYKEYRQQDLSQKVRIIFMEKSNQSRQSLHTAERQYILPGRERQDVYRFYESVGFERHAKQAFLAQPQKLKQRFNIMIYPPLEKKP
jgi:hypothetical protein